MRKIANVIGILALIFAIIDFFKMIHYRTDTKLYDDDVSVLLEDARNLKKLQEAIDKYHETGDWDDDILREIKEQ